MADLPAISDANLYAAKSDDIPVPGGEETTHIGAADLNAIRARMAENRTQANTALSTAEGAVTDANNAQADAANAAGAIEEHVEDTSNPHEVTASQVGAIPVTEGGAGYVPVTTAEGTLDTDDALTFDGTTLDTPGLSVGSGGVYSEGDIESEGTVTAGEITTSGSVAADVDVTVGGRSVELKSGVAATHSAATLTLTAAHHNQRIPVDTASNNVEVRIGTGLPAGFSCELRKTSASNAITFASGGGYITPVEYGTASSALNALTSIFVESSSHAETITVEPS